MKVLLVATSLHAESIGGGESFIIDLANGLAKEPDCSVVLLVGSQAQRRITAHMNRAVEVVVVRQRHGYLRVLSDLCWTGRRAEAHNADMIIYPHEWKPLASTPTMLVVQNVFWMHPVTRASAGLRGRLMRATAASELSLSLRCRPPQLRCGVS